MAELVASVCHQRKGEAIRLLEVEGILVITSYFVIATGRTRRHLQGIADEVTKELRERGVESRGSEGYRDGQWVLVDFGEVVLHLFEPEARERYDLEGVWADAPRIPLDLPATGQPGPDEDPVAAFAPEPEAPG